MPKSATPKKATPKKKAPAQKQAGAKKTQTLCFHDLPDASRASVLGALSKRFRSHAFEVGDDLAKALADQTSETVLVAVLSPAAALAQALAEGVEPQKAMADLSKRAESLLKECRKARRKVLLVAADAILQGDAASLETLQERLGSSASKIKPSDAVPKPDSKYLLLADALMRTESAISKLNDEISAMTLGSAARGAVNQAELLAGWANWQEQDRARIQLSESYDKAIGLLKDEVAQYRNALGSDAEERELLCTTLQHFIENTNILKSHAASVEQDYNRAKAELSKAHDEAIGLLKDQVSLGQDARGSDAEERELLRTTLQHLVQNTNSLQGHAAALEAELSHGATELGTLKTKLAKLTAERDDLHRHLQEAQSVIEGLYTSTSWRITAPMRAIKRSLSRG